MAEWRQAIAIDPRCREAHDRLAEALYAGGDAAGALAHWREGAQDAAALRRMAWALATDPDARVRDGHEAVALAVRALEISSKKDAAVWDTLAAAYAEAGKFEDAVQAAERAIALAKSGNPSLAEQIKTRVRLYRAGEAFREAAAR